LGWIRLSAEQETNKRNGTLISSRQINSEQYAEENGTPEFPKIFVRTVTHHVHHVVQICQLHIRAFFPQQYLRKQDMRAGEI
jgi:hypothetical protein